MYIETVIPKLCLMVLQYAHQTSFVIITRLRNFQLLELPDEILRLEYFFWAHWKDSYHLYLKGPLSTISPSNPGPLRFCLVWQGRPISMARGAGSGLYTRHAHFLLANNRIKRALWSAVLLMHSGRNYYKAQAKVSLKLRSSTSVLS